MQRARQASLLLGVLGVAAVLALTLTKDASDAGEAAPVDITSSDKPRMRIFAGLTNVENTIYAFDSVWAVTSDLADNFSPGPANASFLRINPATGETQTMLDGLERQPTLAAMADRVWAKLQNRIVAFDAGGSEVVSLPWEADGELLAGQKFLWVTDFRGEQVVAINPVTAEIVQSIGTGRFPVAPTAAFGHVWIPSSTDGTVTIIDEGTLGDTTNLEIVVTDKRQTDVTAVPGGATGNEVWVTNLEGELFAIGAEVATLGQVREVEVDRPINKLIVEGDRVLLLPTWGMSVLVADLASGDVLAEVHIDSIPYRVVSIGDRAWVTSDGPLEALTQIDLRTFSVIEQLHIGMNQSNTTGPTQPFVVGDEIWVPNRGDDVIFAVKTT